MAEVSPSTTPAPDRALLERAAAESAAALGIPASLVGKALGQQDYFAVIEAIIPLRPTAPPERVRPALEALEGLLRIKAYGFPPVGPQGRIAPVVFGTAGHRGEIGVGLGLVHIHAIVTALLRRIEQMAPEERLRHFGVETLDAVRARGMMIGHDNRLFNPDFSFYAAHLLGQAGFRVGYAGRVASPEISRVLPLQGWAGALNFTPSHNPFRYGGLKFSPADGGLAAGDLSDPLAEEANRVLEELNAEAWPDFQTLAALIASQDQRTGRVDVHAPYLEALAAHPVVRLGELVETLQGLPPGERLRFVADPVWGGAVPVYQRLLEQFGPEVMTLIHTEDDPYFGGQSTEPSADTFADAEAVLRADPAKFKVAIRNDPDGDRGLAGDQAGGIKMNRFAALVMRYLIDIGAGRDVVTTLPTSRFGVDYARSRGKTVRLTAVGFKNFRPHLLDKGTMVAYEESDGLTIAGHTLDKDGVLAGLLALRIVLHYRRPLSELLAEIEAEIGPYHYRQVSFPVDILAEKVREKLQRLRAIKPGARLGPEGLRRTVVEVNSEDGFWFAFEEGGWILMRPSGTEPKVRIYAETRTSEAATLELCELGKAVALEVLHAD